MIDDLQGGETVYHYCSMGAFLKIVESVSLRLTNLLFMNDYAEHYWLRRIAAEVIDEITSELDDLSNDMASWLKEQCLAESEFSHVYCTCFSEHEDSLGQWRAYGDDGRGVAMSRSQECCFPRPVTMLMKSLLPDPRPPMVLGRDTPEREEWHGVY